VLENSERDALGVRHSQSVPEPVRALNSRVPLPAGVVLQVLTVDVARPGYSGLMVGAVVPPNEPTPRVAWRGQGNDGVLLQVLLLRIQPHGLAAYAEAIWDWQGELRSVELLGGQALQSSQDYARANYAMRLARIGVTSFGGRRWGSRTGMDHQTWRQMALRLRNLVRREGVSLPGAIAQLNLKLSERQGRQWLADIDELEPEIPQ